MEGVAANMAARAQPSTLELSAGGGTGDGQQLLQQVSAHAVG